MEVNGIRTHLDGHIEVSDDHGLTWKPFKGIVINQAVVEATQEFNRILEKVS